MLQKNKLKRANKLRLRNASNRKAIAQPKRKKRALKKNKRKRKHINNKRIMK